MSATSVTNDPSTWRTELNGVPARLISQSGVFEDLSGELSVEQEYVIRASDLFTLANNTFPAPLRNGQMEVMRTTGMPGFAPARARRITWKAQVDGKPIDPFNADPTAAANTYGTLANIIVSYRGNNAEDDADPEDPRTFLELTASATGEFIHGTPTASWWRRDRSITPSLAEPSKEKVIPQTVTVPMIQWTARWPQISSDFFRDILIKRMRSRMGQVNVENIPVLFDAEKETVMFMGFEYSETYTATGTSLTSINKSRFVSVAMKFVEKRVEELVNVGTPQETKIFHGHNSYWRPGHGWKYLTRGTSATGSKPTYTPSDLNDLFAINYGACQYRWDHDADYTKAKWTRINEDKYKCTGDGVCVIPPKVTEPFSAVEDQRTVIIPCKPA